MRVKGVVAPRGADTLNRPGPTVSIHKMAAVQKQAEYDIVLYGATGFTGSLVAQYLAEHPEAPKVAFAGRNAAKVRAVRERLKNVSQERIESIGLLEASAGDEASLRRLAQSARVVINTVGPFSLLGGFEVARAVAEAGGRYVDLTGESNVYHRDVQELHELAQKTGAVIVPSSGFDSLPFDLSTYFAVQEVKKVLGASATVDRVLVGFHVEGSMSGGTLASGIAMKDHPFALQYSHPYWLSPVEGKQVLKPYKWRYLPQFDKHGSFSPFTAHNTRLVYRSWGLLEEAHAPQAYGGDFGYEEAEVTSSCTAAYLASTKIQSFPWVLKYVPLFDRLASRVLPQGTGPSLEEQEKGCAVLRTLAYAADGKTQCLSTFSVKGDPGYLKTAAFISESALTLAKEQAHFSALAQRGGVLTPATVAPDALRARLAKYGGVTIGAADVSGAQDLTEVLRVHP